MVFPGVLVGNDDLTLGRASASARCLHAARRAIERGACAGHPAAAMEEAMAVLEEEWRKKDGRVAEEGW